MPTPSPEVSKALTGNAWTRIFDSADSQQGFCRGYSIDNYSASAGLVEAFIVGLHDAKGDPDGNDQGVPIFPGTNKVFYANESGGGGMISEVWVRSHGATIGHGKIHN